MAVRGSTLSPDMALVEVTNTLVAQEEIVQLRTVIQNFVNKHYRKLVIDFNGVNYVNSVALGVLVGAHASYANRKWELRLCNVNNSLYAILAVARLTNVFKISETREDAVKNLG
jgi:anti-anti-sigma factor